MPGGLTLLASSNAGIPTPAAGKVTIYFSTDLSAPAYKDDTGVVHPLVGATGSQGPQGPAILPDDPDEPEFFPGQVGPQGATGTAGAAGATGPAGATGVSLDDGGGGGSGDGDIIGLPPTLSEWQFMYSQAMNGLQTATFTNLSQFSEVLVIVIQVTFGGAQDTRLQVSTDNGSTFLTASGDYVSVASSGAETNQASINIYTPTATAARSGFCHIQNFNKATVPKLFHTYFFSTDNIGFRYVANANALSAVKIFNSGGAVNFTGGTVYVLGRR